MWYELLTVTRKSQINNKWKNKEMGHMWLGRGLDANEKLIIDCEDALQREINETKTRNSVFAFKLIGIP